jgi:hypothetical protein
MRELLEELNIKQHFTSVEYPQTNGQAKFANMVILRGLKIRFEEANGNWPEELPHILWAYHTTLNHQRNPFPSHFWDRGRDTGRSKGIKLEDGTSARPNRQRGGHDERAGLHRRVEKLRYANGGRHQTSHGHPVQQEG